MANISGARLREAERQLSGLKGEGTVSAFLEAHPHETKVLQQLVDWRRAGRVTPPLARVQRAMVWSDGTIELSTVSGPESAARAGPSRQGSGGPGRGSSGADRGSTRGSDRGFGTGGGRPPSGTRPPTRGAGSPAGPAGVPPRAAPAAESGGAPAGQGRRTFGDPPAGSAGGPGGRRPGGASAPYGGRSGGPGSSFGGRSGGSSPPFGGRPRRPGQRREEDGGLTGDVPRSGEGWALVRPGETLPMEPDAQLPDEGPEPEAQEAGTPEAIAQEPITLEQGTSAVAPVAGTADSHTKG